MKMIHRRYTLKPISRFVQVQPSSAAFDSRRIVIKRNKDYFMKLSMRYLDISNHHVIIFKKLLIANIIVLNQRHQIKMDKHFKDIGCYLYQVHKYFILLRENEVQIFFKKHFYCEVEHIYWSLYNIKLHFNKIVIMVNQYIICPY